MLQLNGRERTVYLPLYYLLDNLIKNEARLASRPVYELFACRVNELASFLVAINGKRMLNISL